MWIWEIVAVKDNQVVPVDDLNGEWCESHQVTDQEKGKGSASSADNSLGSSLGVRAIKTICTKAKGQKSDFIQIWAPRKVDFFNFGAFFVIFQILVANVLHNIQAKNFAPTFLWFF